MKGIGARLTLEAEGVADTPPFMAEYTTLAAVDLGSNSFRLQIGRVVDSQIYELDSLKETVRLAAGLDDRKNLTEDAQARALDALQRFGERLAGFPAEAVRAVGTNTLRVAKNSPQFLARAESALGFPIEVIAGREEARLIYLGVAHGLPRTREQRLVVDISGGSTECTVGTGLKPIRTESLYMGCVSFTQRFFANGRLEDKGLREAELAARAEVSGIAETYIDLGWERAIGSSGTARALAEIITANGWSSGGITRTGLKKLRNQMLKAGELRKLALPGLTPDRVPVIAGGFAIMAGIFAELDLQEMQFSDYALRHGVLYDLLGRSHHKDMREATVEAFMRRYQVDRAQAERVEKTAFKLHDRLAREVGDAQAEHERQMLAWAARLHETGISIAYSGYHKHSAYILANADMPGFSRMDQAQLAALAHAHRGALAKSWPLLTRPGDTRLALALRLSALLHRRRGDARLPGLRLAPRNGGYELALDGTWLASHPLTEAALRDETAQWQAQGVSFRVRDAG